MKRVPQAREVDRALRSLQAAIKQALQGVNQAAAKEMAKGRYPAAEALAAKGREIQRFAEELDSLRRQWSDVRRLGAGTESKPLRTAQWSYYQPILKALVAAGGETYRAELETAVEQLMTGTFQAGDHEPVGRGTKRWQLMIRRARKHLAAEGWIEGGSGKAWRITEAGRRATAKPLVPPKKEAG